MLKMSKSLTASAKTSSANEFLKPRGIPQALLPNELLGFCDSLSLPIHLRALHPSTRSISESAVVQIMSEFGCFSGAQFPRVSRRLWGLISDELPSVRSASCSKDFRAPCHLPYFADIFASTRSQKMFHFVRKIPHVFTLDQKARASDRDDDTWCVVCTRNEQMN